MPIGVSQLSNTNVEFALDGSAPLRRRPNNGSGLSQRELRLFIPIASSLATGAGASFNDAVFRFRRRCLMAEGVNYTISTSGDERHSDAVETEFGLDC